MRNGGSVSTPPFRVEVPARVSSVLAKMCAGKMYAGKMFAGKMFAGKMYAGKMYAGKMIVVLACARSMSLV